MPQAPRFKVRCPHCQHAIVLERDAGPPPAPSEQPRTATERGDDLASMTALEPEIFPPGARIFFHFIVSDQWRQAAENFFQDMGFYQSTAKDPGQAVLKLRMNDYHFLLIDDAPPCQPLLREIATWPGNRRRSINLVLLGDSAQSLDPHAAFVKGVNTYLNGSDVERASELFSSCLRGYEEAYRYFGMAQGEA